MYCAGFMTRDARRLEKRLDARIAVRLRDARLECAPQPVPVHGKKCLRPEDRHDELRNRRPRSIRSTDPPTSASRPSSPISGSRSARHRSTPSTTIGTCRSTALAELLKNQLNRPSGPSTVKRYARLPPPLGKSSATPARSPPVAGSRTGTAFSSTGLCCSGFTAGVAAVIPSHHPHRDPFGRAQSLRRR